MSSPLSPLHDPPALRTATLRLSYRVEGHLHLPSPPAAVWRGQLGEYLHRLASEKHHEQDLSLYQRLFRTPRSAVDVPDLDGRLLGALGLAGEHVPHPFVVRQVRPPRPPATDVHRTDGDPVQVEWILLGTAVQHLPQLTGIAEVIGTDGLGRRTSQPNGKKMRGRAALEEATLHVGDAERTLYDGAEWTLPATCGPDLYDRIGPAEPGPEDTPVPARPLRARLITPTRLKHCGDIRRPDTLTPAALVDCLYRRVVGMSFCYGRKAPPTLQTSDWREAFWELAEATSLDTSGARWTDDQRYSHRQERTHPAGGIVGTLCLDAPAEARRTWARWLRRTEDLHLGKSTSMGLGRLEVPRA
jgi:hypothetical protein